MKGGHRILHHLGAVAAIATDPFLVPFFGTLSFWLALRSCYGDPFLGPKSKTQRNLFRYRFWVLGKWPKVCIVSAQVTAFWQWINFAWAEAEEAKETPLVLNADETCIAWVKGLSGTVA